jgi:hypothetical protein
MKNSVKKMVVPKKKRGRPFTGVDNRDPVTAIRLSSEFRRRVDEWAARQEDEPLRSEAIRRLVEKGLAAEATEDSKPRRKRKDDLR